MGVSVHMSMMKRGRRVPNRDFYISFFFSCIFVFFLYEVHCSFPERIVSTMSKGKRRSLQKGSFVARPVLLFYNLMCSCPTPSID